MPSLLILQILISIIMLAALRHTYRRYKQSIISVAELIGWSVLWLVVAVVFWQPQASSWLAQVFGVGRGADLITYGAILFLLFFLFRLSVRLDKLEKNITKIVRSDALARASERPEEHKN